MNTNKTDTQHCNECGRSVRFGSGYFVNRVLDANSLEQRIEMLKPHPIGEYICVDCYEETDINDDC